MVGIPWVRGVQWWVYPGYERCVQRWVYPGMVGVCTTVGIPGYGRGVRDTLCTPVGMRHAGYVHRWV